MRPLPRLILLAALALAIAACGFQLRGQARLPAAMDRTWLQAGDDTTAFMRELRLRLKANGAELVDGPESGAAVLRIVEQNTRRRPLSVSGQARVREYVLEFEVVFELAGGDGEPLIESEHLALRRDYTFDEREILAASREEEFLRADLYREMAGRLLRRLEAVGEGGGS